MANNNQTSSGIFNGMIAPLIPYGIKGAIWYQGESNSAEPGLYHTVLPALITDWRAHWGQGDFPFLVVQLPNFGARRPDPAESNWAGTREAQALALKQPNAGIAVTIDIGEPGNIHPLDKPDVGHRLALAAEHIAYGDQNVVYSGPTYKSSKVEGNKIRIQFDNIGGGLTIGRAPDRYYTAEKLPIPQAPDSQLQGFAVAGADQKYVWANATIDGDSVVVGSDAVPSPLTVRYAWADNPLCNLYNKDGLPAAPFRTDNIAIPK
jgi:sialate O-acetylesterase